MPGLVDMHVHFREPGLTHKEDITSGCQAAARGGYTTVCCMPNTHPVVDDRATAEWVLSRASKTGLVNVITAGALSMGQNGLALADFDGMRQAGVRVLSDDGKTLSDLALMRRAVEYAKKHHLLITDHAEPEVEIVRRDISLAKEYDTPIHLQHISLAQSVALIREAKRQGIPVTAETAPHYFTLTQDALLTHGANAKMNPPLCAEADRLAVIQGLRDGTIDVIATDHAPHTPEEKALGVQNAPFGVVGLETAFAISYTHLVRAGHIDLQGLVALMSVNPAKILGLGDRADDWVVFDVGKPYTIDSGAFASKGRNTPFQGMEVYGKTFLTVCKGKVVYRDRQAD
jgi:dihydroorotase